MPIDRLVLLARLVADEGYTPSAAGRGVERILAAVSRQESMARRVLTEDELDKNIKWDAAHEALVGVYVRPVAKAALDKYAESAKESKGGVGLKVDKATQLILEGLEREGEPK